MRYDYTKIAEFYDQIISNVIACYIQYSKMFHLDVPTFKILYNHKTDVKEYAETLMRIVHSLRLCYVQFDETITEDDIIDLMKTEFERFYNFYYSIKNAFHPIQIEWVSFTPNSQSLNWVNEDIQERAFVIKAMYFRLYLKNDLVCDMRILVRNPSESESEILIQELKTIHKFFFYLLLRIVLKFFQTRIYNNFPDKDFLKVMALEHSTNIKIPFEEIMERNTTILEGEVLYVNKAHETISKIDEILKQNIESIQSYKIRNLLPLQEIKYVSTVQLLKFTRYIN